VTTITRYCLHHRRLVVLAWLLTAILGAALATTTISNLTHNLATPGTAGFDANMRMLQSFGIDGNEQPTIAVLTLPANQDMHTAAGQAVAQHVFDAANRAGHLAIADYADTHDPKLVSADGRTTWAVFDMPNPDLPSGSGVMEAIPHALESAAPHGVTVSVTGFEQLQTVAGTSSSGPGILVETVIGGLGALIVLLFVFGSAIAVVPLLIAIPSILASLLLTYVLTQVMSVNFLVQYLVAVMGLGIAVDYSLLLVTRWREERESGLGNEQAVIAAGPTAGRAVFLSGLTVAVGLLSLVVMPAQFLRSIGIAGMIIPLCAIAAAVTLLPIILATLGPTLDKRRFVRSGSTTFSRAWAWWGRKIVRRRWIAGALGLAAVLLLAAPALSINTGPARADSLGGTGAPARTLHALEATGVPSAIVFPIQVLTHGGAAAADQVARISERTQGIYTALAPATPQFRHGGDAIVTIIPTAEGNTSAGAATVGRLREALAGVPGGVQVGGNTAQNVDFHHAVYGHFWLLLTVLSLLTFLLLLRTFRSVVLAAKAVIVNVTSLGASFGFLVLFWQNGHGSNQIYGVPATGSIQNWIPIVSFAFLFGISMDYEVFILARMREEYDRTGETNTAVTEALARTGRLVTCAAVILAISFASLSSAPDITVEMIATGIGAGILVDALIVRTLLVPAFVAIMGRWNWWMPTPLGRLLRVPAPTDLPEPAAEEIRVR
jgi:RND superfamily putative drug exporter